MDRLQGSTLDEYAAGSRDGRGAPEVRDRRDPPGTCGGLEPRPLGVLERAILRLAAYELLWAMDVPAAVVIDEAVELAKRFCSDEAGALVNGVLGSLIAAKDARHTEKLEATLGDDGK